jgi:hypothetical protein
MNLANEIVWKKASDVTISWPLPKDGENWGNWRLNMSEPVSLDFHGAYYKHDPYWIPLKDMATFEGLGHWLHHLSEKHDRIFTDVDLGQLVRAVVDCARLIPKHTWFPNSTKSKQANR